MKKVSLWCATLAIFIILLWHFSVPYVRKSERDRLKDRCFEFVGNISDTTIKTSFRDNLNGVVYEKSQDPFGVYNKKNGIVSNPYLAYNIAYSILSDIYGENQIKEELPLKIYLLNDCFWVIEGSLGDATHPNGKVGGVAKIVISKVDGQIQAVFHEK